MAKQKQRAGSLEVARELNKMRIRALVIKDVFLGLGTTQYTPLIDVYATANGTPLTSKERMRIRQIMNAHVYQDDLALLDLAEKAANHHARSSSNA